MEKYRGPLVLTNLPIILYGNALAVDGLGVTLDRTPPYRQDTEGSVLLFSTM